MFANSLHVCSQVATWAQTSQSGRGDLAFLLMDALPLTGTTCPAYNYIPYMSFLLLSGIIVHLK